MANRRGNRTLCSTNFSSHRFGGIDVLVNNASAISLTGTEATPMKKYDLMHQINVRGTFAVSRAALPHLLKSGGHILMMSPPLEMRADWFGPHPAYTMSKYGMSMAVLGLSVEFQSRVTQLEFTANLRRELP